MAITKGAKKAHRASQRKRVFNVRRQRAMNDALKVAKKSIAAKEKDTQKLLAEAFSAIDKAAKRGIIKPNAAARKKARLAAAVKRATA